MVDHASPSSQDGVSATDYLLVGPCSNLNRRRRSYRLLLSAAVVEEEEENSLSLSKPTLPLLVDQGESLFNRGPTLALDGGVPLLSLAK